MTESETLSLPPSAFLSRRQFVQLGLAALGAAWTGTWVQSRLFPPATYETEATPVIIPLAELPVGGSLQITYGGLPVAVLRTPESIKAFSLICTHLGCLVEWRSNQNEFFCPCHDGRFDQFGEVTSGPPPVPLEMFPVRVVEDQIIVGEEV
jgi:cytochrome b6-f complex iron-sulfur subunit